jgi:hypothetical protein
MKHESTLGRKIRLPVVGLLAGMAVSLSAWAYWPWESISVTSHYDANGSLVGVEAVGACGFPLVGQTGASTIQRMYSCDQLNEIEMPF